jgi:hypothetical protein
MLNRPIYAQPEHLEHLGTHNRPDAQVQMLNLAEVNT